MEMVNAEILFVLRAVDGDTDATQQGLDGVVEHAGDACPVSHSVVTLGAIDHGRIGHDETCDPGQSSCLGFLAIDEVMLPSSREPDELQERRQIPEGGGIPDLEIETFPAVAFDFPNQVAESFSRPLAGVGKVDLDLHVFGQNLPDQVIDDRKSAIDTRFVRDQKTHSFHGWSFR